MDKMETLKRINTIREEDGLKPISMKHYEKCLRIGGLLAGEEVML